MPPQTGSRSTAWPLAITAFIIAAALIPVASSYIGHFALPFSSAAGIYGCFLLLLVYLLAPAITSSRIIFQPIVGGRQRAWLFIGLLCVPYLLYAAGTGDFRVQALARLILLTLPVFALYAAIPVSNAAFFTWQDAIVALWMVSTVLLHFYTGIWNVPTNLDFMARLFMACVGALCWTYTRPIPDFGYEIRIGVRSIKAAVHNFFYFTLIAIPLGFALHFTAWRPRWTGPGPFLLSFIEILLFIAILEELFFRGFLQNLLEKTFRSHWLGQLIASVIFGLFHILHAPFPNWRYVILASIAGWFYGSAYRSGGTLLSSVLVHASVDTIWRAFLTKS